MDLGEQGPPDDVVEYVASLWSNVEELEATISHLKSNLKSTIPKEISQLRQKIEEQALFAKSQKEGSMEAALAWETLEELDTSLAHMVDARKVSQKTDMDKFARDIEQFRKQNPLYQPPNPSDVQINLSEVEAEVLECDFAEMLSVDDRIEIARNELAKQIEYAQKLPKGDAQCASAWDMVEELEAEISHLKARCS